MRTGEFWEEERFSLQSSSNTGRQTQSKQDVTASPKKAPCHVANTDKNYGLIQVIGVNKKPELLGQSVYN